MREFKCKNLGYDDNWSHIAPTEELLTDIVAVHLREVHGIREIAPDLIGRIKNSFSNPAPADASAAQGLVLKEYNCTMDPKCGWRYIAQTEDLIADGAAVHARETHGIREFTPEMIATVKKTAHEWKGWGKPNAKS